MRCGSSSATRAGAPGSSKPSSTQDAWFVVTTRPTDPFATDPEHLWRDVLRRQRGRVAMFANHPEDPTVN